MKGLKATDWESVRKVPQFKLYLGLHPLLAIGIVGRKHGRV